VNTPRLNLSQTGRYSIYLPRKGRKAELTLRWPVTYRDGLPASRRSPIQVYTNPAVHGRELNSQRETVDHKSDALTSTPPSHPVTTRLHIYIYLFIYLFCTGTMDSRTKQYKI